MIFSQNQVFNLRILRILNFVITVIHICAKKEQRFVTNGQVEFFERGKYS